MKLTGWIVGLILAGSLTGCGTVQTAYKPDHLGNLSDDETDQGIQITLSPDKYRARIGEPVTFKLIIRNVSDRPVWFPGDPDLLLTWVYPDGRRDNLIRGERSATARTAILLKPGQEQIEHSVVTTYYFDRAGIHEFRAIVTADANTASGRIDWQGRAVSNGFGVFFEEN
jgi:hypothetical protein